LSESWVNPRTTEPVLDFKVEANRVLTNNVKGSENSEPRETIPSNDAAHKNGTLGTKNVNSGAKTENNKPLSIGAVLILGAAVYFFVLNKH
jgi:hypothetical protein